MAIRRINVSSGRPLESRAHYSRALRAGDCVLQSGTTAIDRDGNVIGENDIIRQVDAIFEIATESMALAAGQLSDVVCARLYVTDPSLVDVACRAAGRHLRAARPVMSVVPVRALARPAQLVEIELEAIDGAADQAHRVPQRLAEEDPFYRSFALRMGDRIWIGGAASPSALNGPQRETNVDAQTRRALSWMEERLAELGASLNDLVCTRTSLRDLADADAYREARRAVLGDTRPTSTLFGAGPFSDAGQRFEIDAEARVGVAESRVEFFGHEDRERSRGFALAVSAGEHVYVSGCNALDEQGRVVAPGDWAAQYDFCIQRIADLLERAGLTLGDVVQRRTLTVAGAKMNRGYGEGPAWFAASHPAALGCRVDALAHPDLVVEIDATAIRGAHAGIEWRSLDG